MSVFKVRARRVVVAAVAVFASVAGVLGTTPSAGASTTRVAAPTPVAAPSAPSVAAATMPGGVTPLRPTRLLDTRTGRGAPVGPVAGGQTRSLTVTGTAGVPASGVAAVVVSLTVTGPTGTGYVTAYASGSPRPATSNLNYVAGQTATNLAVVPVGSDGRVVLGVTGGATHLLADVSGWVADGAGSEPGAVATAAPARLLDTRYGVGAPARRVTGPAVVRLTVAGRAGVPATGASAVLLNVTAVSPTKAGYLSVTPVDAGAATTSSLNFPAGRTVSNLVLARLSAGGTVDLRVSGGTTVDLLADVFGRVAAGDPVQDGALVTSAPKRVFDSRSGAPLEPGSATSVYTSVPGRSAAAVVNVTVVGATANGYATVSAPGAGTPNVSQLTYARGATVATTVVAPVDAAGWVRLTVAPTSRAHVVVDLAGWVVGAPDTTSQPGQVGGTAATASGAAISLSWTAPAGPVSGYVVRRRAGDTAPTSPFDGVALATPVRTSFTDTRVAPGVTYSYAVFARDAAGSYSESVPVTGALPAQSWGTASPLPERHGSPTTVSCPTTTWCMVGDQGGAALVWNGTSWSGKTQVVSQDGAFVRGFRDVSCPTTTFCLAGLTIGGYAVYRAGAWRVVAGSDSWSAVDCHSATRCGLVGETASGAPRAAFWNGTAVTSASTQAGFTRLVSVSCPTATLCWAGGDGSTGAVRLIRASGTSWTPLNLAPASGYNWVEVSCSSGTFCMVTSFDALRAWTWNGSSWRRVADTQSGLIAYVDSLSCTSPTACQGLGGDRVARWNGSSWAVTEVTRYHTPGGSPRNRVVDCATSAMCLVVDTKGRFQRWNGSSWAAARTFDATVGGLAEVSCPSTTFCLLADELGSVLRWTGAGWTAPSVISESGSQLSCLSATWCLAVDQQSGTYRKWTGAWGPTTTFDNVNFYSELACASTTACFLVEGGDVRRFNGSSWSGPVRLFPNADGTTTVRIVCPAATSCLAVDMLTGRYSRWNGTAWSAAAASGLGAIWELSCATANSCSAIADSKPAGSVGVIARFDGKAWRSTPAPWSPSRIACGSTTRCVATGVDDSVWVWDGLEWGRTTTTLGWVETLACRGTWCMAVGNGTSSWTR